MESRAFISILKPIPQINREEEKITMCILQIHMQCFDRFFEVSEDEVENAELIVEDAISRVLVDLFEEGSVDDVSIHFSPNARMGLQHCSIQIRAQCSCQCFSLRPHTKENMELAVEKSTSSLLRELFGTVSIDHVMMIPSSQGCSSCAMVGH
jgi:hypothetical protein